MIAELLVRLGVGTGEHGGLRLADPDTFQPENLNRQAFCDTQTLNRNKAEVLSERLEMIRPGCIESPPLTDGIDVQNVDAFISGADVVIDETDYEKHWVGVMLARAARTQRIPVFTGLNIAWGCEYTCFSPDGMTLEKFLGVPESASISELRELTVDLGRWVVHIPPYAKYSVFQQIRRSERAVPSVSPGVAMTAANVATQVCRYLDGQSVVTAPKVGWDDAMQQRRGVVRSSAVSFLYTLAVMVARSMLGRNK